MCFATACCHTAQAADLWFPKCLDKTFCVRKVAPTNSLLDVLPTYIPCSSIALTYSSPVLHQRILLVFLLQSSQPLREPRPKLQQCWEGGHRRPQIITETFQGLSHPFFPPFLLTCRQKWNYTVSREIAAIFWGWKWIRGALFPAADLTKQWLLRKGTTWF